MENLESIEARLNKIEEKVSNMDKTISVFDATISRFDKSIDKLDQTLSELGNVFIELKTNSSNNATVVAELKKRMDQIIDENNVSILGSIKKNWIYIVAILLLAGKTFGLF